MWLLELEAGLGKGSRRGGDTLPPMGWRELSTDARHWDFWIRLFWRIGAGIVVSIIAGVYLGWWSYIWNLPTPLLVLVALVGTAAVLNIWLATWALLTHYVKWPKTHPLQLQDKSATNSGSPSGVSGDTNQSPSSVRPVTTTKWTSDAERKAAESPPDDHAAPPEISDDEISITTKRDKRGAILLKLHNMEAEPKQRFSLLVTDLGLWSTALNAGRGGFSGYPNFLQRKGKPLELIPSGGRADCLDHSEPKTYELIRPPSAGVWQIRSKEGLFLLKDGVWEVTVELRWNLRFRRKAYNVRLGIVDGARSADFVSQDAGGDPDAKSVDDPK